MSDARNAAEEWLVCYGDTDALTAYGNERASEEARDIFRALLAERVVLLPDEDECPCCLTHSCQPFRRYAERTLRPAPSPAIADVREAAELLRRLVAACETGAGEVGGTYLSMWPRVRPICEEAKRLLAALSRDHAPDAE